MLSEETKLKSCYSDYIDCALDLNNINEIQFNYVSLYLKLNTKVLKKYEGSTG